MVMNKKERKFQEALRGLTFSLEGNWSNAYMDVHSCMVNKGDLLEEFYKANGVEIATLSDMDVVVARALYNPAGNTFTKVYGGYHYLLEELLERRGMSRGKILGEVLIMPPLKRKLVKYISGMRKVTHRRKRIPLHAQPPLGAYNIGAKYDRTPYQFESGEKGFYGVKYCNLYGYKVYDMDSYIPIYSTTTVTEDKFEEIYLDDYREYVGRYAGKIMVMESPLMEQEKMNGLEDHYERQFNGAKY